MLKLAVCQNGVVKRVRYRWFISTLLLAYSSVSFGQNNVSDSQVNEAASNDLNVRSRVNPQVIEHVSQPLYLLQLDRAKALYIEAKQLESLASQCDIKRELLIDQWNTTVVRYMALQGQQTGPQAALDQNWKILFWPDKKNTLGRKMQSLMHDQPMITFGSLQTQSVTVQGLGALEWLLFDSAVKEFDAETVCHWQKVVAQSIAVSSKIIAQSWASNPWQPLSDEQWQQESFTTVNNQLDFMLKKMALPLGKAGKPKPYFAEAWRSQNSYQNLYSNLNALKSTLMVERGVLDQLHEVDPQLYTLITQSLQEAMEAWPQTTSLFLALPTDEAIVMHSMPTIV